MLPFLKAIEDGQTYRHRDVIDKLANVFNITYEERKELLPSGRQGIFDNRVGWARTYLKKAALIESPQRGSYYITQRGKDVLSQNPAEITNRFLAQFPEFRNFTNPSDEGETPPNPDEKTEGTPEELLEYAYKKIKDNLAQEIIDKIKTCSPKFFENLVIDLLLRMGYGGSRKDAGQSMGKTGDGGIDGIIKEDRLGLDIIYIQAKRWEGQVPVKEIRDFAGSLLGKRAKKGIFITTSSFPQTAQSFVDGIEHKIILIDGQRLSELMLEHNVGVSIQSSFEVKKIDTDYFSED